MRSSDSRCWLTGLVVLLALADAGAQQQSPEQALARAQGLLRQVSAQKQELEVANARMAGEIAALEKKLRDATGELKNTRLDLSSEKRMTERTTTRLELVEERLDRTNERFRTTLEQLREANAELRELRFDKDALESELAVTESSLADSESKNLQLYELTIDLTEQYRRKGFLSVLLQRDPLTGLKDTQIQNIIEEYRMRAQDALRDTNRETVLDRAAGQRGS